MSDHSAKIRTEVSPRLLMSASQAAWVAAVCPTRSGTLIPKTGPVAGACTPAEGLEGFAVVVVVVAAGTGVDGVTAVGCATVVGVVGCVGVTVVA